MRFTPIRSWHRSTRRARRIVLTAATLAAGSLSVGPMAATEHVQTSSEKPSAALASASPVSSHTAGTQLRDQYGLLPLHFESNQGQVDSRVKFVARGRGYSLFLTPTEAVLRLRGGGSRATVLRLALAGAANPAPQVVAQDQLLGRINYFIGNDPSAWRTNVPTHARVRYQALYPGIDLI